MRIDQRAVAEHLGCDVIQQFPSNTGPSVLPSMHGNTAAQVDELKAAKENKDTDKETWKRLLIESRSRINDTINSKYTVDTLFVAMVNYLKKNNPLTTLEAIAQGTYKADKADIPGKTSRKTKKTTEKTEKTEIVEPSKVWVGNFEPDELGSSHQAKKLRSTVAVAETPAVVVKTPAVVVKTPAVVDKTPVDKRPAVAKTQAVTKRQAVAKTPAVAKRQAVADTQAVGSSTGYVDSIDAFLNEDDE